MTSLDSRVTTASYPDRGSVHKQLLLTLATVVLLGASLTAAHAQTFTVVYNFGSQSGDPFEPYEAGIIAQGRDGNMYSTAPGGAPADGYFGAAYKVTPSSALTVLYDFGSGTGSDGGYPYGGLTLGADGNFYGTTNSLSGVSNGTVFKMTPAGALTTFYSFADASDGARPYAPPIQGTDGNFYGTTSGDGSGNFGSIYKITPSGTFTVLYTCEITHCEDLQAPLIQGTDGNFYGTSEYGGTSGGSYGTIFKITSAGKLTVIYNFDYTHGAQPIGGLVQATDGNFYGTTEGGGTLGVGVVFKITPTGKLTVLHSMNGTTDGGAPYAGLVQATDGNFYGANPQGGAGSGSDCPSGCGTIFKVTKAGAFSTLYNFDQTTGQLPYTTMMQHTNGILYGTTQLGGTGDAGACGVGSCGVLYSLNIGVAKFAALVSTSGKVGVKIGILGQNFSGSSVVTFGTVPATVVTRSGTTFLTATVPSGAATGSVTVTTTSGTLTSSKTFRVTPQLKTFTPASGPVGTPVTITGVSLTQTTKVTFGGVASTIVSVNSDTQVTATVPTGAKTGKIVITTGGGTATSATNFTVTP
jgi:uncharacterized repeat protein (TIGR03803 family)